MPISSDRTETPAQVLQGESDHIPACFQVERLSEPVHGQEVRRGEPHVNAFHSGAKT